MCLAVRIVRLLTCLLAACNVRGSPPASPPDAAAIGPAGTVGEQDGNWLWTNPIPKADSLFGVTFRDTQVGIAAGIENLQRTNDGGITWTPVPSALDYS